MITRLRRGGAAEVAIERGDGVLVDALLAAGLTVVVITSRQVKNLRSRYGSSGAQGRPVRRVRAGGHAAHGPGPAAAAGPGHPRDARAAGGGARPQGPGRPPGRGVQPAARPPGRGVPRPRSACSASWTARSAWRSWPVSGQQDAARLDEQATGRLAGHPPAPRQPGPARGAGRAAGGRPARRHRRRRRRPGRRHRAAGRGRGRPGRRRSRPWKPRSPPSWPPTPTRTSSPRLPRAGTLRAARLLAEIGDCRARFPDPWSLAGLAGVAPVTRRSGTTSATSFRWAVNRQLRDAVLRLRRRLPARQPLGRQPSTPPPATAARTTRTPCASRPRLGLRDLALLARRHRLRPRQAQRPAGHPYPPGRRRAPQPHR